MSVVGIDLGNKFAKIAQAKRGGVDLILNENSQRLNSVLVSFNGKERFIGEAAVTQVRSNFKNTVTQIKRLIGRKFSDPDVQYEARTFLNYKLVQQPGDEIGIEVMYNDAPVVFTPQQILAMFLTKIRDLIETSTGAKSSDVVISIPPYFTDSQRLAITNACEIAGVKCLRLLHDTTAAALAYGMFRSAKGEFDLEKETKVVFVCMGHSCFTVTVVGFVVGKLRIISSASAPNAGGRDLDAAVAKHWAAEFEAKAGVNVWDAENRKGRIKLLEAAEKCKKNLSPWGVNTTPVNLECLHGDSDFRTNLTIETFEELAQPVVAQFEAPIRKAMADANVTIDDIDVVEILGGSMRPRIVKSTVAKVLGVKGAEDGPGGYGLGSTMNMDECVARGCAFESAMISPLFRVSKTVEITDRVSYPIRVSWNIKGTDPAGESKEETDTLILLEQGAATPTTKRITFKTVDPFTLDASYDESAHDLGLSAGADRRLGQYRIEGVPEDIAAAAKADPAKMPRIRIDFAHDSNGIFGLLKAELLKEAEEESTEAAEGDAAATPAEGDAAPDAAPAADADGAGSGAGAGSSADAAAPGADADAAGDAPAPEGDAPTPAADSEEPARKKKKRYQRVHLSVSPIYAGGLTPEQVTESRNREAEMATQDAEIRATQDKRNELETYIYQTRDALVGRLSEFATDTDKTELNTQLTNMEDWLYGDGFDSTKDVYQQQLDRLRLGGDPIFNRENESNNRDAYVAGLTSTIEWYKRVVTSTDPKYEHLELADREKIGLSCKEAEDWLATKLAEQAELPKTSDPVLTLTDLRQMDQKVKNVCHPIESKKKPEPPKEEAKAPEAPAATPAAEASDAGLEGSGSATGDDSKMDVEAPAEDGAAAPEAAPSATPDTDMAGAD